MLSHNKGFNVGTLTNLTLGQDIKLSRAFSPNFSRHGKEPEPNIVACYINI